jgi:hypothetical protein
LSLTFGTGIQDPLPQAGLRRKTALPDTLPVGDFLAGKIIEDTMDPECHEAFGVSGPPKEAAAAPPRDRDRNDNLRVPSHDEPPKKRKSNTVAVAKMTKAQLEAENASLRAAASQLPVEVAVAKITRRTTKAQLEAENASLRAAVVASQLPVATQPVAAQPVATQPMV